MNFKGAIQLDGVFEITHIRDGKIIDREVIHNTTTNVAFKRVAGLINGRISGAGVNFDYLALDQSTGATAAASTGLAIECTTCGLGRAAATCTWQTTTNASDTAQMLKTFSATNTKTIYGAGVFDTATTGGNMLAGTHFAGKAMVSGDTLAITYKVKVA